MHSLNTRNVLVVKARSVIPGGPFLVLPYNIFFYLGFAKRMSGKSTAVDKLVDAISSHLSSLQL